MQITRESNLTKERFIGEYLNKNKPVIVVDELDRNSLDVFSPENLLCVYGHFKAHIYNDLFDLQNISSIQAYITNNFNLPKGQSEKYLRGYTKFKALDFFWMDDFFKLVKDQWNQPKCLPESDYLLPFSQEGGKMNAARHAFLYKGLFLSGKGACTSLHKDPMLSNAVLCQFYGKKKIIMYPPDQKKNLEVGGRLQNFEKHNDAQKISKAKVAYEDELKPGEMVFFPTGWYHHVESLTDSVSVTWNFVHKSGSSKFVEFLKEEASLEELEVAEYFCSITDADDQNLEQIRKVITQRK